MCKELDEELKRGDRAILLLAEHLLAMGASEVGKTVAVGGQLIKVSASVVANAKRD